MGQDVIFDDSYQDQIIDIAPDIDLVKNFVVKTPFDKKCGVHSSMAHSECNTEKKGNQEQYCQATGTGTGPGPGIGYWDWGLGLGNEELGRGNGKMGNGKIGNREYPYSQSQEMTV